MKTLSSSEFRRTFARLTEPVTVTALGRPIAVYSPLTGDLLVDNSTYTPKSVFVPDLGDSPVPSRPPAFRPAPKPMRKKR